MLHLNFDKIYNVCFVLSPIKINLLNDTYGSSKNLIIQIEQIYSEKTMTTVIMVICSRSGSLHALQTHCSVKSNSFFSKIK